MLTYEQSTGRLTDGNGVTWGFGYSGFGEDKNQPASQSKVGLGPAPQGRYNIGQPYESPRTGPFTIPLIPLPTTNTFGRTDFRVHGDSIPHPGTASHGCIILGRHIRERIKASGETLLEVIA
jgi:hypothetical protein